MKNLEKIFDSEDKSFILEGYKKTIIRIMKAACFETLEFAADNAKTEDYYIKNIPVTPVVGIRVSKQSILNLKDKIK